MKQQASVDLLIRCVGGEKLREVELQYCPLPGRFRVRELKPGRCSFEFLRFIMGSECTEKSAEERDDLDGYHSDKTHAQAHLHTSSRTKASNDPAPGAQAVRRTLKRDEIDTRITMPVSLARSM